MIIRLLFAIALLAAIVWLYKYLKTADPAERKRLILKYAFWGLIGVTVLAVVTGRMHWLGIVFAALLGFLKLGLNTFLRFLPVLKMVGASQAFNSPVFKTSHIEARLDLSRGTIEGAVINGPHTGKRLDELSASELEELANHYRDIDKRSYYLIMVIRQRQGGQQYGSAGNGRNMYADAGTPSIKEALQILGLEGTPARDEIIQAHRRLIQKLHPDRGGNDYLASRVNLAKDVLLESIDNP